MWGPSPVLSLYNGKQLQICETVLIAITRVTLTIFIIAELFPVFWCWNVHINYWGLSEKKLYKDVFLRVVNAVVEQIWENICWLVQCDLTNTCVLCRCYNCSILPLNRAGDMKNEEVYVISSPIQWHLHRVFILIWNDCDWTCIIFVVSLLRCFVPGLNYSCEQDICEMNRKK